jgi:predicted lipoprotein with Yx(FWY)xxD motif
MKMNLICGESALAGVLLLAGAADAAGMLTAKNGMTLYVFDNDTGGTSSCYDDCAKRWPPYVGKEGAKMEKGWTLIKRKDGTMQWAYEGKPLYFYADDKKRGDKSGDGKGGVWHIVTE